MVAQWYVIHVYSGFEKKVADSIEEQARQSHLSDMFEVVFARTPDTFFMRLQRSCPENGHKMSMVRRKKVGPICM